MYNAFAARSARCSQFFLTTPQRAEFEPIALDCSRTSAQAIVPPAPDNETATELLQRLRVSPDLVQVYCSTQRDEQPLFLSRALLAQTSPQLAAALQRHFLGHVCIQTLYLEANPAVLAIFVYWLFHRRLPAGSHSLQSPRGTHTSKEQQQQQITLVRAWNFADHWDVLGLQNDLMAAFFRTLDEPVDARTLETCLQASRAGSAMRFALMAFMLWWDELHEALGLSGLLCDAVDISGVEQFEEDFGLAVQVLEHEGCGRGGMDVYAGSGHPADERPRAEQFFVGGR